MTSPARRLRDALEPVAALSFYSDPSTAAYASVGLPDFFPAYFWARSSVLGVADASVVGAAFGVWEPGFVRTHLEHGQRTCSLDDIRTATQDAAGVAAREVLAEVGGVPETVAVLRRGIDAADATARTLFAGNRAWAWPDDPYAGLWRAATAWRELRGDSHLAACVVHGISGLQANILNELDQGYRLGEYTSTRNWSSAAIAAAADALRARGLVDGDHLGAAGNDLRDELERVTDLAVEPAVAAVGAELDDVVARVTGWGRSIIDRGWFPDDDRKRAAG